MFQAVIFAFLWWAHFELTCVALTKCFLGFVREGGSTGRLWWLNWGLRCRSELPDLGALNWGTLWTQKNVQGPLTHPTANAGSLVRCLQLIGMSETPKGEVLLIFFTKVRRKFPLDCNLQMPTLYPQTLFLPALGSAESVQLHVTSQLPKAWGEDKKLSCRWLVPYSCLQSAFTAAEMMCKREQ